MNLKHIIESWRDEEYRERKGPVSAEERAAMVRYGATFNAKQVAV